MHIRSIAFVAALLAASIPAFACKRNSDCKVGQRCINADNHSAFAFKHCGSWNAPDWKQTPSVVVGSGSQQPTQGRPNRAATGEVCRTDRDCPSGKTCTRAGPNAVWRCVIR